MVETSVEALDDRECSGKPRDLCESFELSDTFQSDLKRTVDTSLKRNANRSCRADCRRLTRAPGDAGLATSQRTYLQGGAPPFGASKSVWGLQKTRFGEKRWESQAAAISLLRGFLGAEQKLRARDVVREVLREAVRRAHVCFERFVSKNFFRPRKKYVRQKSRGRFASRHKRVRVATQEKSVLRDGVGAQARGDARRR